MDNIGRVICTNINFSNYGNNINIIIRKNILTGKFGVLF